MVVDLGQLQKPNSKNINSYMHQSEIESRSEKVGVSREIQINPKGVHLAGRTFAFINIYSLDTASGGDSESRGEVSAQLLEKSGGKIEIAQTGELRSDGVFDCGAAVGGWLSCVLEVVSTRYQVLSAVLLCLS